MRVNRETGCHVVCYADDTLVIATAEDANSAAVRAGIQVARILFQIKRLGLRVFEEKMEAVIFHGRVKPVYFPHISVGNSRIKLSGSMKYLGIIIDSKWSFGDHFAYVEAKVAKVTRAPCKLMPNLRGPGKRKRQLYSKMVQSVILYGAPIWCDALGRSRGAQRSLRRVQRVLAIRVISAYRTTSCDAASLLARIPPLHVIAMCRKRVYEKTTALKASGNWTPEAVVDIKNTELLVLYHQWAEYLRDPSL